MEKAEDALGGRLAGTLVVDAAALPGYGREPVGRAGRLALKSFKYVAFSTRVSFIHPPRSSATHQLDHWT